MRDRVAVVACADYDQNRVDNAIKRALDALGGLEAVIKPGMRVAIKANLLKKNKPEDCVTTHPSVICAVAKRVNALGAQAIIGDSPGGPFTENMLRGIYREAGMEWAAENSGATLNFDTAATKVRFLEGVSIKTLDICKYLVDADVIINCAKLKTHGLTTYTGAVKNMYGAVPGTVKVEYHFRMPELDRFANMLIDICEYTKPALNIIDAVIGMEGEGPGSGDPRPVGCIVAAQTPYAADMAGIALMNQKPMSISTLYFANRRKLVPESLDQMQWVGDDIHAFVVEDFKVPSAKRDRMLPRLAPEFMMGFIERVFKPKPVFSKDLCIGCGECMRSCPPKAISMVNRVPKVDLRTCIRCFCCQELCPKHAVTIKRSRILRRIG